MTLLDQLRKANAERDPSPWTANIEYVEGTGLTAKMSITGKDPYMPGEIDIMYYRHPENNIRFITLAANSMSKLLDVVDAAIGFRDFGSAKNGTHAEILFKALEALESEDK